MRFMSMTDKSWKWISFSLEDNCTSPVSPLLICFNLGRRCHWKMRKVLPLGPISFIDPLHMLTTRRASECVLWPVHLVYREQSWNPDMFHMPFRNRPGKVVILCSFHLAWDWTQVWMLREKSPWFNSFGCGFNSTHIHWIPTIFLALCQVAIVVKTTPANSEEVKRSGFDPWVWKIPWRRSWQSTPVFLPG